MSLLQLHEISKIFGGLIAINELSFSVEQGSVVGLIGPNGAGKTTVFNCITGNYKPEHGRITFGGQDITGKRPHNIVRWALPAPSRASVCSASCPRWRTCWRAVTAA